MRISPRSAVCSSKPCGTKVPALCSASMLVMAVPLLSGVVASAALACHDLSGRGLSAVAVSVVVSAHQCQVAAGAVPGCLARHCQPDALQIRVLPEMSDGNDNVFLSARLRGGGGSDHEQGLPVRAGAVPGAGADAAVAR